MSKLKNVKMFEDFGSDNLNEGSFKEELDNAWYNINIMHSLMDEGYIDNNGQITTSFQDANDFLNKEHGEDNFFSSDNSVKTWVINTMEDIKQFASKHV